MNGAELNKMAANATLHCLTGCAVGEVIGLIIGAAAGWPNALTVVVSILLAFVFGYGLSITPLLQSGVGIKEAFGMALAADTLSIATMEVVDSGTELLIPG